MSNLPLKAIYCRNCDKLFHLCRSCWRGHAYCSAECRDTARKRSRRRAQRVYRQTQKGKENHRLGEKRRRAKKKSKTVDDQSSTHSSSSDNASPTPSLTEQNPAQEYNKQPCCHFCGAVGEVVKEFPRRGYG